MHTEMHTVLINSNYTVTSPVLKYCCVFSLISTLYVYYMIMSNMFTLIYLNIIQTLTYKGASIYLYGIYWKFI